jgi:hypothetical protein
LTVGLYAPALQLVAARRPWRVPIGAAVVSTALIVLAMLLSPARPPAPTAVNLPVALGSHTSNR